jgi:hypothetical protein
MGTLITHAYDVITVIGIKAGCWENCLHNNSSILYQAAAHSANERVGSLVSCYKLPGSGSLGSNYIAYIFVFLSSISNYQMYKVTLWDQTQVNLQLRISLYNTL